MPEPSKGGPRLLVTDREGAFFLERASVKVENGRVVYHASDDDLVREYNIPHVNLAVLFLGQGTSITQDAMRLLGEEGVHVAVTGSGGSPLHMGGLTNYGSTAHFRELVPIYLDAGKSLAGARAIMTSRAARMESLGARLAAREIGLRDSAPLKRAAKSFREGLASCKGTEDLMGFEGNFAKSCYRTMAEAAGLGGTNGFRRQARREDAKPQADVRVNLANDLVSHGNYLCYGMAGAALWALGIPPHMALVHGKTRPGGLVFDIADAFKDSLVLPIAFGVAGARKPHENPEKVFRAKMIDAFDDHKVLAMAIQTMEDAIEAGRHA